MALTKIGTDGVKDDAVTSGKIPANAVGSSEIADDAVTYAKMQNTAQGARLLGRISAGGGQIQEQTAAEVRSFLNVADGATASSGTTINNNADNRVITGSGTANTLEGESNATFDGTKFSLTPPKNSNNDGFEIIPAGGTTASYFKVLGNNNAGADGRNGGIVDIDANYFAEASSIFSVAGRGTNRFSILGSGRVGIGTTSPAENFHINAGNDNCIQRLQTSSYDSYIGTVNSSGSLGNNSIAGQLFLRGQNGIGFSANSGTASQVKITSDGLCFGTDTAAANALDDYEEGIYTPTITANGGGTISLHGNGDKLSYTKIGRLVTVHGTLQVDSVSSPSGDVNISLPFTAANLDAQAGRTAGSSFVWAAVNNPTDTVWALWVNEGTNYLFCRRPEINSGTAHKVQANTEFFIGISYPVA